jgi:peptide/nickel transport system permease protein
VIAPETTYWDIVKTQFRKHRTAVWGLRILVFLFVLATVAPVLATSSPFAIKVGAEGSWEFPWFRDLFNQNRWRGGVDLFFNLTLLFLVPTVLVWFALPRVRRASMTVLSLLLLYCFASVELPDSIVESETGKYVFLPQHLLRQRRPKEDHLDTRRVKLDLILADQKIGRFERKLQGATAQLEAVTEKLATPDLAQDDRWNLEAEKAVAEADLQTGERELRKWRKRKEKAEEAERDPKRQVTAIMPPIGFHHDDNDEERITQPPSFSGWGSSHFLGTDNNGRDVAARMLYGTRISLTIGVLAVAIYCTIGTILGALMGFFGGVVDMLLMRLVEILICFPTLAFIMIIVAVFQTRSIFLIMVAIALIRWTTVARLIRGQFLQERSQDYVAAAQALGIPTRRIVFKHVLPNAIHPMFVAATFGVAAAILVESGLAFLGLGDPEVPSWGQIMLEGRSSQASWLILSPGVAIFLTVTVLNLVGEGLRDALDPKLRQ